MLEALGKTNLSWEPKESELYLGQVKIFKKQSQKCHWIYEKVKREREKRKRVRVIHRWGGVKVGLYKNNMI